MAMSGSSKFVEGAVGNSACDDCIRKNCMDTAFCGSPQSVPCCRCKVTNCGRQCAKCSNTNSFPFKNVNV